MGRIRRPSCGKCRSRKAVFRSYGQNRGKMYPIGWHCRRCFWATVDPADVLLPRPKSKESKPTEPVFYSGNNERAHGVPVPWGE